MLIALSGIVSNIMQVLVGHTGKARTRPFFIQIGLVIATGICFLTYLPREGLVEVWLFVVIIVTATGVGMLHPESFRAIYGLDKISASTCTAVFMVGGMLGVGAGGWISTLLVSRWGMVGLTFLVPVAIVLLVVIGFARIQLIVEEKHQEQKNSRQMGSALSFWPIWLMTIPAVASTSVIWAFLPSRLEELGFKLEFGGYSYMLLLAGGVAGTLSWAIIARKRRAVNCATVSLLMGVPFFIIYTSLMKSSQGAWLLAGGGFFVVSSYSLMLTEIRFARGLSLGLRMALGAGGTWAIGCSILMVLGKVADKWGLEIVINWAWTGFVISAIIGLYIIRKKPLLDINNSDRDL